MDAGSIVVVKNYLECNLGGRMKRIYNIKLSGEYYAGPPTATDPYVPMTVIAPRWALVIRRRYGRDVVAIPDWNFHQTSIVDLIEIFDTMS